MEIAFSNHFKKAYKKCTKGNMDRHLRILEAITLFSSNPYHPQLKTHKLTGGLNELYSFTVEYDLRIIFFFKNSNQIVLEDVGSHDEVY